MKFYKKILSWANAALMTMLLFAVQVEAAVPEEVKSSIKGSQADGLEVGWIVVGVVAALFVIRIVKGIIR